MTTKLANLDAMTTPQGDALEGEMPPPKSNIQKKNPSKILEVDEDMEFSGPFHNLPLQKSSYEDGNSQAN